MTTCRITDKTDANQFPNRKNLPTWEQDFARVPTIGESIFRGGGVLRVKDVFWYDDDEPWLTVEWEGWLD